MHPVKTPRSRLISSLSQSWSPLDTSRVDTSKVLELAPASDGCLGWGRIRKMVPAVCIQRNLLKIPAPPARILRLVNTCPLHIPQALCKVLFLCCVSSQFIWHAVSLTMGTFLPVAFWLSQNLGLLIFQSQTLWEWPS